MSRVLVVGAGVLGVHHAKAASDAGHDVVICERDLAPRSASVRNFGLIWCSGRAPGRELELALDARRRWEAVAAWCPGIGFRAAGSMYVADNAAEAAVLEEFAAVAPDRGLDVALCTPAEARAANPALARHVVAALWCRDDAVVEPRCAVPALLARLAGTPGVEVRLGTAVLDVEETAEGITARTTAGRIGADVALVCPGADHTALFGPMLGGGRIDRCRLQMMETAPAQVGLATALADGGALRYYPGFAGLESARALPGRGGLATSEGLQLLCVQRTDGGLTIGDSHDYDEPFSFDLDARVEAYLLAAAGRLLGTVPPVVRRWQGVYSRARNGDVCLRCRPSPRIVLVTGLGGRGMTLSPAVAAETMRELGG